MKTLSCLILGAAFCQAQDAMEILRRTEDTYRRLRSLELKVSYKFEIRTGSAVTRDSRLDMRWIFRAPGKFRRTSVPPAPLKTSGLTDGQYFYSVDDARREYIQKALPPNQREFPPEFSELWLATRAESASIARQEQHDGTLCWVITGRFKPRGPGAPAKDFTAWIERERSAIHQVITEESTQRDARILETWSYSDIRMNPNVDEAQFFFTAPAGFTRVPEFSRSPQHPLAGKVIPPLLGLESIKGRVALLFFWTPDCCNENLAFLDLLAQRFGGPKFVVLGISKGDLGQAQGYLKENGYRLDTISDTSSSIQAALQISSIPAMALITADGALVMAHLGATPDEIRRQLAKLGIWP